MSKAAVLRSEPRKTPLQARSAASVDAILQATVQVLLREGKSKLTTTRIAHRAGVSVGTLYQYFPNKRSLLQALLKVHLDRVAVAIEDACLRAQGASLEEMAESITSAFVKAKFRNIDASIALYTVSDDIEGRHIARGMHTQCIQAMSTLFQSAPGTILAEPDVVAATLFSAITGVSRAMFERGITRTTMEVMRRHLTLIVRAYLQACSEQGS